MRLERYLGARFLEHFYAFIKKLDSTSRANKREFYRRKWIDGIRDMRREAMLVTALPSVGNDESLNQAVTEKKGRRRITRRQLGRCGIRRQLLRGLETKMRKTGGKNDITDLVWNILILRCLKENPHKDLLSPWEIWAWELKERSAL